MQSPPGDRAVLHRTATVSSILSLLAIALCGAAGLSGGRGVAGGLLLLRAVAPLFAKAGIEIPVSPDPLTSLSLAFGLALVGVVPALRAARIPPSEAPRAW